MTQYNLGLTYDNYVSNKRSIADCEVGDYIVYERLDGGAFGTVYRGMNKQTGEQVAVKLLDLAAIERDQQTSDRVKQIKRRLARTESEMMIKINSTYVMKCFATYENKWLKIMIVEYCNGGTLAQEIFTRGRIPEDEAIDILKQLINGVAAMHQQNIVHRDLKSQNIMSHNGVYKIVDLGFSKMITQGSQNYHTTLGTIVTMAPEVMRKQKYGLKADIWSIGIIFYQMIYGCIPYEPMKAREMYEQIIGKNIFPNYGFVNGFCPSEPVLALMKKMLTIDQKKRIGWQQLVSQPIFKNSASLSSNFRITSNVGHLTKHRDPTDREENDVIENLKKQEIPIKQQNSVSVSKMKISDKQKYLNKIDKTEEKIMKWARQTHLECLKTELILKRIILPIENYKIFSPTSRQVIQLMFLLSTRCFFNMSFVKDKFQHQQNFIVKNLKLNVMEIYQKVQQKFFYYSSQLTNQENKIKSIVKDRLSKIFENEKITLKDKFFGGLQMVDFTKQKQIKFTYQTYIVPLLKNLDWKEDKKHEMTISYLQNYQSINELTLNKMKDENFEVYVKKIVDKNSK